MLIFTLLLFSEIQVYMPPKIIRSLCLFTDILSIDQEYRLNALSDILQRAGFEVQTRRIVTGGQRISSLQQQWPETSLFIGAGTLTREETLSQLPAFLASSNISFNLEIKDHVRTEDVDILFDIIRYRPEKTFNFSYTFCNPPSSPYFPAAHYQQNGFAVGLQPTDLSEDCDSLHTWLYRTKQLWDELVY